MSHSVTTYAVGVLTGARGPAAPRMFFFYPPVAALPLQVILLAYSDGRFGGLCPPRCIWFCAWCGRQSRPHQAQKRNVSGACGPRTPTWRVCQQYHRWVEKERGPLEGLALQTSQSRNSYPFLLFWLRGCGLGLARRRTSLRAGSGDHYHGTPFAFIDSREVNGRQDRQAWLYLVPRR